MPSALLYRLTALLALASIWIATHRYLGIHHDGLFYAAQAVARINPAGFRNDLFFAFGSQDDFSLFSLPYAWLVERLGLGSAAILLLIGAQLAWAAAAFCLARHWLQGAALWLGLGLIFALPRAYGAEDVLHYAESFLTARSWAEPLVLAGVAATLARRPWLAGLAIAAAFLSHPIIALPGLVFFVAFHARPGARLLVLAAVAATLMAFALPPMDADWLAVVRRRAPFILLDRWQWYELAEPFTWIGILLVASATAAPLAARAYRTLALVGAIGVYLSLLGIATHATLLIQAQPWRCLWLLKLTGLLALTGMFQQRWQTSNADRWLLAGLTAAALTANTLGGPVAILLAALAHLGWRTGSPTLPPWLPVTGGIALAVVTFESMLAVLQQLAYLVERVANWANPVGRMPLGDPMAMLEGPLALALPIGLLLLLHLAKSQPRVALTVAALCLPLSAAGWYRAQDSIQTVLLAKSPQRPFDELIAGDATVYWQNNFLYTWFLLRQGNYASKLQSVGVVFSRGTAMESTRRLERLAAFGSTDTDLPPGQKAGFRATRAGLTVLCADPVLDHVVVNHRIDGIDAPRWFDPLTRTDWHLYHCADFRASPSAVFPHPPSPPPRSRSAPPHHPLSVPAPAPV